MVRFRALAASGRLTNPTRWLVAIGCALILTSLPSTSTANTPPSTTPSDGCTIKGTARADRLIGTSAPDVICGLGGNDVILGNGGGDTLIGGPGNDRLDGGTGSDLIMGGDGRDTLIGGAQPDQLMGGTGTDQLTAGTAGDTCAVDSADRVNGICAADITGPEISNVQIPAELTAGETLTVWWRVADPSGIDSPGARALGGFGPNTQMIVGGPSGFLSFCDFPGEGARISGTSTDGVYQSSCEFPATTPNETYTVMLRAADVYGNVVPGFSQNYDFKVVNGAADNLVPVVSDIRTDASAYAPGDQITITFRATDQTGVAGVIPWAYGPNGQLVDASGALWLAYDLAILVGGDATDGTYSVTLKLSATAAAGTYNLYFSVRDVLGNRSYESVGVSFTVI